MYKMVLENEHALGIINGLHEIAGVRDYDLWVLGVALLAVIVSGIAATAAFILNKEQKNIAKTQANIMKQQNKIALFDKKFFYFNIFKSLYLNSASFDVLDEDMLGEIEAKLTVDLISSYNKLKIGVAIILSQNILDFDSENKYARHDLVNYASMKIKELLMLVYPIRYVFNFNETQANELNKLTEILFEVFTKPEHDDEVVLKKNLKKLESFFETTPLYEYLEKQVYIIDNLKYFPQNFKNTH